MLDEGEYQKCAHAFFGHAEEPVPPDARWRGGPSLDGLGEFTYADPAPRLGQEPELAQAPTSAHDGLEATRTQSENGGGITDRVKEAVADKLS